jgi:hypothetical protein
MVSGTGEDRVVGGEGDDDMKGGAVAVTLIAGKATIYSMAAVETTACRSARPA